MLSRLWNEILTEPMTMLTDFMITGYVILPIWKLWNTPPGAGWSNVKPAKTRWAWAFVMIGLGAFFGGVAHGFKNLLSPEQIHLAWKLSNFTIGLTSFFLLLALAEMYFSLKWRRVFIAIASVKLIAYLVVMSQKNEFLFVIMDYLPVLLIVLGVSLYQWLQQNDPAAPLFAVGVLISLAAAAVQMSGFALHQHMNHNDIFHLIQIVGLHMFYRGTEKLELSAHSRSQTLT